MTDKTLKILLGIIVINLTIQTVKDVVCFRQLMRKVFKKQLYAMTFIPVTVQQLILVAVYKQIMADYMTLGISKMRPNNRYLQYRPSLRKKCVMKAAKP